MTKLWRQKLIAFTIHLLFSAVIIGIFMLVVTQLWFPDVLYKLENVWEGLQILIPVDAILGPFLTLLLFVPGKKGLVGDLIIIATLQIMALLYGGFTIYNQRPEIIVFAGDRFEIIPSSKFNRDNFQHKYFENTDITYPFLLYSLPAQTKEQQSEFVINNVQYQKLSERYRPLADHQEIVLTKALQESKFVPKNNHSEKILDNYKLMYRENDVSLFILQGTTSEANIIILNNKSLAIEGYLDLNPWTDYKP